MFFAPGSVGSKVICAEPAIKAVAEGTTPKPLYPLGESVISEACMLKLAKEEIEAKVIAATSLLFADLVTKAQRDKWEVFIEILGILRC